MTSNDRFNQVFGGDDSQQGSMSMPGVQFIGGLPLPPGLEFALAQVLGGPAAPPITGDEVDFHDGGRISLPKGMSYDQAHAVLARMERDAETEVELNHVYRYRPNDGAYAAAQVLRRRYGITFGETIDLGIFGSIKPETRSIKVSVDETVDVLWGRMSIPSFPGVQLAFYEAYDEEYGTVFAIHGTLPKKHQPEVKALFEEIEQELKDHSIYRGQAVVGTQSPEFLDLSGFNPNQIVFADDVTTQLEGTLWSVLRYRQALKREGIGVKRSVLLYGPYGTGKTSTGQLTAQIAVENGWTFISARPGDDVNDVLKTARLYQPAVVFVEDIDNQASSGDDDEVSELLETFDGITAKGGELVVVLTTNRLDRIHKGMLRPGRLDAVIEVNSLDRGGVERLIKAVVPTGKLDVNVDYGTVFAAMDGFFPAFVREALDRAKTFAVSRLHGTPNYVLTTEDLVGAAQSLQPQLKLLNAANEGEKKPALHEALTDTVQAAVHQTQLKQGPAVLGELVVPGRNGHGKP